MAESTLFPDPSADPRWHRYTTAEGPDDDRVATVVYGANLPTEADLRLLGPLEGKRVLDLGCGSGHNAVVCALEGAKVIGVEPDGRHLATARARAEQAEVKVELHEGELAELPFLRSDSVDAALSVMALTTTDDLARVFRQVHRVLKPEAPLVCSFPHPAFTMLDVDDDADLRVIRSYDDPTPIVWDLDGHDIVDRPRTIGDIFTTLHRANFRVDQIIEPVLSGSATPGRHVNAAMAKVPATVLFRARKQGN